MEISRNVNKSGGKIRNKPVKPLPETPEKLTEAVDSLAEQKKKYDIAMYYTHQDAEKAKNMVAGAYKDLFVIKVKFSISTTYGAFITFFNIPYCNIVHSFVIMSHSYIVDDLKTKAPWRDFEKQMEEIDKQGGHDGELSSKMRADLSQTFTMQLGPNQRALELKKYLEQNDQITANRIIQKFIHDKFGYININPNVEYEQISSLDMELYSVTGKKLDKELSAPESEKEKEEPDAVKIEEMSDEEEIDKKDIQLILKGNLILSPVKGKDISSVETGDRIKITLDNSNPKAVTVAKAFKSYDEGRILPITGRVVSIRRLSDGGYKIFCIIAKGIYVKIEEEEEGIKIAAEMQEEPESRMHSNMPVFIAAAIVFFVLLAVALVLIFKLK